MSQPSNESTELRYDDPGAGARIVYPRLSVKSVLGALFGVASALALVSPLLWIIPLVGAAVCLLALREIRVSRSQVRGRALALAGLTGAALFATTAVARQSTHTWIVHRQARQFGQLWFEFLQNDQPEKAYQLLLAPTSRQPLDNDLWQYYRQLPKAQAGLRQFVKNPLVRTLLALKDKTKIRYWTTDRSERVAGSLLFPTFEKISLVYAVTFGAGSGKTTFFARLVVARFIDSETGTVGWQIAGYRGGVRPGEDFSTQR